MRRGVSPGKPRPECFTVPQVCSILGGPRAEGHWASRGPHDSLNEELFRHPDS